VRAVWNRILLAMSTEQEAQSRGRRSDMDNNLADEAVATSSAIATRAQERRIRPYGQG
jgi:hypothetical protein